jgi:hypothetical protein
MNVLDWAISFGVTFGLTFAVANFLLSKKKK